MRKFSIIIATYNASGTLQECLDSIRPQKNEEVELLIIDGESTDSTLKIIEANRDLVDYYIHEKDQGIYDAWNKGIKVSHGEWIAFLGADDTLCPDTLQKYIDYLSYTNDKGIEYISGRINYIDNSGRIFCKIGEKWDWPAFSKSMSVAHVASLHRRSLFKEVGPYDLKYKICGDYELLIRKKSQLKTAFIDHTIANMRMGGISFSTRAIRESCRISNSYTKRSFFSRVLLCSKKYVSYYLFILRIKFWRLKENAHIHIF